MKTNIKYICISLLMAVISVNAWGTTIASWGKVSIAASTAITASGGDANNSGVASFSSTKAMTTAGTYAYYGSSAAGAVVTFSNLNLSGYTNIKISFYSRASGGKAWQIMYSPDGTNWYSHTGPNTNAMTNSETLWTVEGIPPTATHLKLTHLGSSGSLYFGTITIYGDGDGECTDGLLTKGVAAGDEIVIYDDTDSKEWDGLSSGYGGASSFTTKPNGAYTFIVEAGATANTTYSLKYGNKYLTMSSNAATALALTDTKNTTSSWTISIDNNGVAKIRNCTNTNYYIKYNKNSYRFTSYTSDASGTRYPKIAHFCPSAYHVTYNPNGATSGSVPVDNNSYDPAGTGQATVLGNTGGLVKTGYSFGGWNTNPTGTGSNYTAGDQFYVTDNITLYAKWTPNPYTISLDNQNADAGKGGTSSISVTYDASTNLTGTPAITVPQKTGYTFGGYYTDEGGSGTQIIAANGNVNASAGSGTYTDGSKKWKYTDDITLYALWTQVVSLKKNTGADDGSVTVVFNKAGTSSFTEVTKTGWTCTGYWTNTSGGYKVIKSDGAMAEYSSNISSYINSTGKWVHTGATDLYAQWVVNGYYVTFNKNATLATGEMDEQEFEYGTAQNLTSCAFSYTGHTFEGWSTTNDGDVEYTDGEEVNNLTAENAGIVELYAVWSKNSYTLTVGEPSNVTIKATPDGGSDIIEGDDAEVEYEKFVTLNAVADDGYTFAGWKVTKDEDGSDATTDVMYDDDILMMPAYNITVTALMFKDYVFSCSELSLTGPSGDLVFITSKASKTVRSQEAFHVTGSGLTPGATVTFSFGNDDLNEVFSFKKADGTAPTVSNADDATKGTIDADIYVFYTPASGSTTDGIETATNLSASVAGTKPKTATLNTKTIIGRHLPADFVIAAKNTTTNKWYALPANMSGTGNPEPVEIAVDDINNPTIAYTAASNIYNLYLSADKEKVQLGMKNNVNGSSKSYALWANNADESNDIGKNTGLAESTLGDNYKWTLAQTNTSITNAQDAKYTISNPNNANALKAWFAAGGGPKWGLYASGESELRLIPASASSVVFAEASVVAWGQHSAIIETDAGTGTVLATKVVGKLPEDIETTKKSISQTGTSVKGTGTRYNYTVNFGSGEGGIDFSANEGKMLTLEWYNSSDVLVAVSNVMVPRIVATNTTINKANYGTKGVWNTEVHVLPGDTLFIDASAYDKPNLTINELHVYPNATVQVLKDTLIVKNLILRNGWNRLTAEKEYDVARLYIKSGTGNGTLKATNAYLDWYIDYDQYYPIAVPWKVATSAITYKNMTVDIDQGLMIRYYDGERHAKGGDGNTNWKQYSWDTDMPTHLVPGIGYAITARRPAGKAFSIIRMPLTIPSADWTKNGEQGVVSDVHKDQVSVTAWVKDEGETPDHAKGWNFIANPYMSMYQGEISHSEGDAYDIAYVNIPDVNFKEFDQVATDKAKLKPGSGFLIQTEETGTLTFGASNRKVNAPSYVTEAPKASKQKAYIILNGEEAEDEMGLIISDIYTADYEINADLEKLLSDGNTLRTYMIYNNINMAYVAINEELAKEWIPVTVRIPESGEYTYSLHEASKVGEMEGIYLIDYSNGQVTNLIMDNYSFTSAAGTIEGRFAINAIVGKHDTPTDIDIINAGGDIHSDKPVKFIWNDKVFILHNGVIYDSTGKKVRGGAQ